MERELTLLKVPHPDTIDNGAWIRVEHPVLDPLFDGAPDLGWEGDSRLVVYLHLEAQSFCLWRLEANGEYMPVAHLPAGASLTNESVNKLISRLVEIDTRRGFDPYADVIAAQDAADRDAERDRQARLEVLCDKMLFGLARQHLPGVDISKRVFTFNTPGG